MKTRALPCSIVLLALLSAPRGAGAEDLPPSEIHLPDLLREALERNPEVQMAAHMVDAKRARIPQAGALPDPVLMYGVENEGRPIPFETLGTNGFSDVYVGVTQEIPFHGKRGLREKVAGEEASAEEWRYEGIRRRVAAQVAEAYYDLYATHAALGIVDESLRLLDQLTKVTRARLAVGQVSQQDVLDAEVELSRLEERKSTLERRRVTIEANLQRLLLRAAPAPLGRPAPVLRTPLSASLEELLARAEEESPMVHEFESRTSKAERTVDLARRERLPDFGVKLVYFNRGALDPLYSLGGTLTLPIYAGRKQKQAILEARADLGAARNANESVRSQVRFEVTESYFMASTADHLLRLYDEGILKQARLSVDSAIAQYQVGKVDFLTLISSWRRLLDYNLAYHEQLAEHEKALARLAVHVSPLPGQGT